MSEHRATVHWNRQDTPFTAKEYTRDHRWKFDGGSEVHASAAPQYLGNDALVDPEQAFVAALSSCHMLTFLALAAQGWLRRGRLPRRSGGSDGAQRAEANCDHPCGAAPGDHLGRRGSRSSEKLDKLHENAHKHCFIANSVTTKIEVEAPSLDSRR